jgi:hypothetical protein
MPRETKIDCETKKHVSLKEKLAICNGYKKFAALHFWYGYDIFCLSPETT